MEGLGEDSVKRFRAMQLDVVENNSRSLANSAGDKCGLRCTSFGTGKNPSALLTMERGEAFRLPGRLIDLGSASTVRVLERLCEAVRGAQESPGLSTCRRGGLSPSEGAELRHRR